MIISKEPDILEAEAKEWVYRLGQISALPFILAIDPIFCQFLEHCGLDTQETTQLLNKLSVVLSKMHNDERITLPKCAEFIKRMNCED